MSIVIIPVMLGLRGLHKWRLAGAFRLCITALSGCCWALLVLLSERALPWIRSVRLTCAARGASIVINARESMSGFKVSCWN